MVSYVRPHPPLDAPQCYFDLYRTKAKDTALGDWENPGELERSGRIFDSSTGRLILELMREAQIGYYACITHVDHQIGRLLQSLTESWGLWTIR